MTPAQADALRRIGSLVRAAHERESAAWRRFVQTTKKGSQTPSGGAA